MNDELKELTKDISHREKENKELRSFIDSQKAKEDRSQMRSEKMKKAIKQLAKLKQNSHTRAEYFNREVVDHHNCFESDW